MDTFGALLEAFIDDTVGIVTDILGGGGGVE